MRNGSGPLGLPTDATLPQPILSSFLPSALFLPLSFILSPVASVLLQVVFNHVYLSSFLLLIHAHFSNPFEILCAITLSSAALATPPNLPSSVNLINVQFPLPSDH